MPYIKDDHPEQDPAEGSSKTVERELERSGKDHKNSNKNPPETGPQPPAGSEAAEPSPESPD